MPFALPRQTYASNRIYLQCSFVNILSNKLCTSQTSSTYVQLYSVRFEHELLFSAVSFTLRQENKTVRESSLVSLLPFSVSVIHESKEKGEKFVPFHLSFDFLDVKPRYVTNDVMSAATGLNITLARIVWARHSAVRGEEELS
jgi:sensor histidine kinase YesM